MTTQTRTILMIALLTGLVAPFQNCGEGIRFTSTEGVYSKIGGITVDEPSQEGFSLPPSQEQPSVNNPPPSQEGTGNPPPPVVENNPPPSQEGSSGPSNPPEEPGGEESGSSQLEYVCILLGPGKSVRLGVIDESLSLNGKTPKTICTTKRACLEIVSRRFTVKSAEKRGYCPNKNKHVVPMSEGELASILAE
jgi:hypothetical protein